MRRIVLALSVVLVACLPVLAGAQSKNAARSVPNADALHARIDQAAAGVTSKVIAWRRDIHQHPELGNREFRTAGIVADQLRALGIDVKTGVAHTGVVGVLRGGKPGPVVALRADMDALPVVEENDLPFKSTVKADYEGRQVGVMHACGHDAHTAMLLGAATVLAGMKADLPGTVVFLFQPAEEGAPGNEDGGAELMIQDGALDSPKVEAAFGLHVFPGKSGQIAVRPRGAMASGDTVSIVVKGRQTHGALPWGGVDPIVVSSQIVLGLQSIVSRQMNLTTAPVVITIGRIEGGNRTNIVPDEVRMAGTVRTFDASMRDEVKERIKRTATSIAAAAGATAEVTFSPGYPVTYNNPELTTRMSATLARVSAGEFNPNPPVIMASEDFSYYGQKVPAMYFQLGVTPNGVDPATAAPNHSPRFFVDEAALVTGVRALVSLVFDYSR